MNIFVPTAIHDDLRPSILEIVPNAALFAYSEDGDLPREAANADVVLRWIAGKRYSEIVRLSANLRWLHTASAGVDHVITEPVRAKSAQLLLTDSGDAFGIAIGEFVVAWMLMVAHRLPDLLEQQKRKEWKWLNQEELHGQCAGIIGLGPIGRGIGERCRALGMQTIGLRRSDTPSDSVDETVNGAGGLTYLLETSDWVVIAAALTDETRTIIGTAELSRMKPTARIVNIARGGLIDEAALIAALQNGTIGGACLDVFDKEPLSVESPLWTMPNVYIAPHNSSGWTNGLRERQKRLFVDNLRRFANNEPLSGIVDMARGY